MPVPDPVHEQQRLARAGREYYAQFMLACLVLGDRPPGWNVAAGPCERGMHLLDRMDPFSDGGTGQRPDFYWEFRLAARHDGEDNGWPDLAVVWPYRVLLLELKTEPGSVREGQVDRYLDLTLHHFPTARLDLLYITRDRVPSALNRLPERARYATTTWDRIADDIEATWTDAPNPDGAAARVFIEQLRTRIIRDAVSPDVSAREAGSARTGPSAEAGTPPEVASPGDGASDEAGPSLDDALQV